MSRRSWKQRARICASMYLPANGLPIKKIALGFSSPAAYVAAFKSVLGVTPSSLIRPPSAQGSIEQREE